MYVRVYASVHVCVTFHLMLSYNHPDDNEVITFGWNEHGMCATGDENNVQCPHVITAESLKGWTPLLVGGGAGHSMIMVHKPLR